jgi:protein subunit release factor A
VERGISCEANTEVVSHHTTNEVTNEAIEAVLTHIGETLKNRIDSFVGLMHNMSIPSDKMFWKKVDFSTDWSTKEAIGAIFCKDIIRWFCKWCEQYDWKNSLDEQTNR